MTSIAALTQSIDAHALNVGSAFQAVLDAKDRELAEIEAEQSRSNAEFEARKQRSRTEKEKIADWATTIADDIRMLMEGGA